MGLFGNLFKPRESEAQRAEWLESAVRSAASQVQGRILQDMRVAARRSFETAETPAYTESWATSSVNINEILARQLPTLWSRAVGLARNNEWAKRYLIELDDNVLGPNGIGLQMRLTTIKQDIAVQDAEQNALLESAYATWCKEADESGLPMEEVETLAINTLAAKGELLIHLRPGLGPMGFQIQFLDPTLLDVTLNRTWGGARIRMGVEITDAGKPLAYWLQMTKVGDSMTGYISVGRHVRVPASQIIHRFLVEEPHQLRGIPWLTVGARRLWLTHDFEESAAVASSNAAKRQGFFFSPTGEAPPGFGDTIVSSVLDAAKAAGKVLTTDEIDAITAAANKYATTVPGQFDTLPQGYQFQAFESVWPNINADTYIKQQLRGWAAARGLSYISLGNDLEAVNYSSAQVGIIGEREHHKKTQVRLRNWLHVPVFEAVLPYLVLSTPGLKATRLEAYKAAATWQPRRWVPLDPVKAANANETNLRLKLTSRRRLILERGEDPDEVLAEIKAEEETFGPLDANMVAAQPLPPDPAEPATPSKSRHLHLAAARRHDNGD
ncbi:phage portal protein [Thiobacillus sp.]|uniref:phage portal protein n=1 Tax=Thiobacillus sp. TaxID=924 RepID=UPI0018583809|nr:phage portal protein [Thiobacillus sp.]MBC2731373.1 phage portal protein [Thiobacillus sp.]MBC2740110.1 phage portal protein [Thiobacillus sp.]MBC2758322.1 phage portal protein [Thiobacillus sp.]